MKRVGLDAARKAARDALHEIVAVLPCLTQDKALTSEDADKFRTTLTDFKAWARACDKPITLGAIHLFTRIYRSHWLTYTTASNSVVLQTFLYLCEKRRIEPPEIKAIMGGGGGDVGDDEYERLLGALMADRRVDGVMLMDVRLKNVSQCIEALRRWWCLVPTTDGETMNGGENSTLREDSAETWNKRQESIQLSCMVQRVESLSE